MSASSLVQGVTVLIPVHGDSRFLGEALDSVLRQVCDEPVEVLIVRDRPSAEADALLQTVHDPRLRVIDAAGVGLVAALNTGLSQARFDLVARMDDDDIMMPGRLQAQLAVLRARPEVVAVGGQIQFIDEHGTPSGTRRFPAESRAIRRGLRIRNQLAHPAVMLRVERTIAVGAYSPELTGAEDYDLWLRLADEYELRNVEEVVLGYRVHAGQVTTSKRMMVAEATYLAQWARRRRSMGLTDRPLPWQPNSTLDANDDSLLRRRVRAFASALDHASASMQRGRVQHLHRILWVVVALSLRPIYGVRLLSLALSQGHSRA